MPCSTDESNSWVIYGLCTLDNPRVRYVGLTTTGVQRRLYLHKWNARNLPHLPSHKWVRKHYDEVIIRVLEVCPVDNPEYLGYAERYWISELKTSGFCLLNCNDGGWGGVNMAFSDEWRKNQSERMSGENNPMFGKTFSDEHRKKISDSLRGKSSWAKGVRFSDEHRENISKNHANVSGSNNPMYGVPSPNTGKKVSNETKLKMSQARRGKVDGPHKLWHVNRGVSVPEKCILCRKDLNDKTN